MLAGCGGSRLVSVAGVSFTAPVRWKSFSSAEAKPGQLGIVVLDARTPVLGHAATITVQENRHGDVSMTDARNWQGGLANLQQGESWLKKFDVSSGKYTSVCLEGTVDGGKRYLLCEIVGTPLQFNFSGYKGLEADALSMLKSLQ